METILKIVAITAIAGMGGTGLGGLISTLFKKDSAKTVSLLLSFAAGVMTSVVCFDLLADALEQESGGSGVLLVVGGVLLGYGVIYLLNAWIDKSTNREVAHIDANHPKTADSLEELIHADHLHVHERAAVQTHSQLFLAGLVMAAAIALHNMPEGMVIGASFAKGAGGDVLARGGIMMAVVIGLHNIPEGMAVAVPLISGGMQPGKAVGITALSGAPTILGALVGYFLGAMGPLALALSLSFASGAMLYVVFGELLPEAILMWRSKLPAFAVVVGMLLGILIIYA
ncbi:MAG: ZIP family metal transporter [Oscillospiraceae bacterium]